MAAEGQLAVKQGCRESRNLCLANEKPPGLCSMNTVGVRALVTDQWARAEAVMLILQQDALGATGMTSELQCTCSLKTPSHRGCA